MMKDVVASAKKCGPMCHKHEHKSSHQWLLDLVQSVVEYLEDQVDLNDFEGLTEQLKSALQDKDALGPHSSDVAQLVLDYMTCDASVRSMPLYHYPT